jgi:hypothetical protein
MSFAEAPIGTDVFGNDEIGPEPVQTQAFEPFELQDGDVHVWCLASTDPLDDLQQERVRRILLPFERDREASWKFWRLSSADHLIALRAQRASDCRQRLIVRSLDTDWRCTVSDSMDQIGESIDE